MDYSFISDDTLTIEKHPVNAFPNKGSVRITKNGCEESAEAEFCHTYDVPGTYFASVRVCTHRHGDAADYFTQIKNIARVRVIVEE